MSLLTVADCALAIALSVKSTPDHGKVSGVIFVVTDCFAPRRAEVLRITKPPASVALEMITSGGICQLVVSAVATLHWQPGARRCV